MQVVTQGGELFPNPKGFCYAIGMFDGVHLGHQRVILSAVEEARLWGATAVAITFEPHPLTVLQPERAPRRLQLTAQRLRTLESLGLDAALVHSFTPEFSMITGETYVRNLALAAGPIRSFSVGMGFHFGHRRSGDIPLLERLGRELNFVVHVIPPVRVNGQPVRSSWVRELVRAGDFRAASELLGRPYRIEATVETGDQLGRTMGFPTANLSVSDLELPPNGVYVATVHWRGRELPAVLNLGIRPTLQNPIPHRRLEVHLLDFTGDLYGETLGVDWGPKLREETRFSSLTALQAQIARDVDAARKILALRAQDGTTASV